MADNTVFEMEIEGGVYPIEDKVARQKALTPVVDTGNEVTSIEDADGSSYTLADTKARAEIGKLTAYSTTEQDTGKTWIDGKKIYRRCFRFNLPAPNSLIEVATGIAAESIDTVTCFDTVIKNPEGGGRTYWWTPEYIASGNTVNIFLKNGGAAFSVQNGTWSATSIVSITLEYTKVAD